MSDVLSAPFVKNLVASSDGSFLVWEVHLRGMRNLYTNQGGTVHRITAYMNDDGLDMDDIQVLSGNDAVVYMRGGTEDNAGGDNINPLSLVPPPPRGVYLQSLHGGDPLQLGEGSDVRVSPRGDAVAWAKAGTLQVATLQKSATGYTASKPEALPLRGQVQNIAWSPDGSRIAVTDVRNDHSFIVIYTPATHHLVYATPDFTSDDDATWSLDGRQVAFIRTPGNREDESIYLEPNRDPWSIWVADADTGAAHLAWRARRGRGSQFYTSADRALWWMQGDRIAFIWEGTGWANLYSVPARGGVATALATGPFEVETVAASLDHASLLYATNENDIDHRHIWQVGVNGSKPHALTSGVQNQWSPTPLANGGYAYINAWYATPPMVTIGGTGTTLVGEVTPAVFPAHDLVQPRLVTFRAPDGLLIHAQLFVPRGAGRHPAMIFDHGGPVRQMLAGFHYMEAYTNLYESNQYLANHGFVVLSINYRSGIMYGHDFRMAKHTGWLGASEYQDVLAGAHWLQKRADVDPHRLGIYGLSYGGYLTALGLARNSDIFKTGADYAGVHNWATLFDAGYGKPVGTAAQRKGAYDASPIASIDRWRSPVFLSQGDDDRNVIFSQGVDLAARLRDRNIPVETMVFPNETHENQVFADMLKLYDAAAAYLIRQLKP